MNLKSYISARLLFTLSTIFVFLSARPHPPYLLPAQYYRIAPSINPASAGLSDSVNLNLLGNLKKLSHDENPASFVVVADAPLFISGKRLGLSLSAAGARRSSRKDYDCTLGASYPISLPLGILSAGVAVNYNRNSFKISDITTGLPADSTVSKIHFNIGLLYSLNNFNLGASYLPAYGGQGCFYAIKTFRLSRSGFDIIPSAICITDFSSTTVEITSRLRFRSMISVGASYRFSSSVGFIAGVELHGFNIEYDCAIPVGHPPDNMVITHEICIGYAFSINNTKQKQYSKKSIRLM